MDKIFLPGFGLKPSMYSRLDLDQNSSCIDLGVKSTLDETISNLRERTPECSVIIGYSMGARLALACALANPNHFSGLILISMHAGLDDTQQRSLRIKQDQALASCFSESVSKGYKHLDDKNVFDEPSDTEFLSENRITSKDELIAQMQILGLGNFDPLEQSLINLKIPVLYVTGSRDKKYCDLNARYKKMTMFSHHRVLDSDHRVPIVTPNILSLNINWFLNNII